MKCDNHYFDLIHKYLDGEATDFDKQILDKHVAACSSCNEHLNELKKAIAFVQSSSHIGAPAHFTQNVLANLPNKKPSLKWRQWTRKNPILVAVVVFIIFMSASVVSLWFGEEEQVIVTGTGNIQINQETGRVIVPEGEIIQGDLVVKNGELLVNGKVQGNVLLVNSKPYFATTGLVSGEVSEVDQALEWIWYHLKTFMTETVSVFNQNS